MSKDGAGVGVGGVGAQLKAEGGLPSTAAAHADVPSSFCEKVSRRSQSPVLAAGARPPWGVWEIWQVEGKA